MTAGSQAPRWGCGWEEQLSEDPNAPGLPGARGCCVSRGLSQQSSTFLTPGTDFVDDKFFKDWGAWGWGEEWFLDNLRALHLLHTLFLI